jgi:hypothetical protein
MNIFEALVQLNYPVDHDEGVGVMRSAEVRVVERVVIETILWTRVDMVA